MNAMVHDRGHCGHVALGTRTSSNEEFSQIQATFEREFQVDHIFTVFQESCFCTLTTVTFKRHLKSFYPRDAILARVFATAMCLSVRLSVCHEPVLCQNEES